MVNIKYKQGVDYGLAKKNTNVSLSLILSDLRKLQRLLSTNIEQMSKVQLTTLKKEILNLQYNLSENISKKSLSSNIVSEFENLDYDIKDKILEIDKKFLN
ncbi:MAG: hypothetical protein WCY27_02580 [archaeon]|nr:hypothetical protein [archaeon]MDD2477739.1 hypothetical protein [Candidatus ainarchaeum sp.]MDD3084638.1 hypothetical protein [Candidatus ainarchaeum sp.]MDD4221316.1 hypothetical protein [Candidatus ainarchaeum sp.]MDD4662825.1 hypothetical protein [Candidatus ainarchaeum sp.]